MAQLNSQKTTFINRLEAILLSVFSSLKVNISDYCELETVSSPYTIVFNNGSLMTLIAYEGSRTIIGGTQFSEQISLLTDRLGVYLAKGGHQFGMVFRKDLNPASDLFRVGEIKRTTAKNLRLDVDFLIKEEQEIYSQLVYDETNFIVAISHPKLLDSSEIELEAKRKGVLYKQYDVPAFAESQAILLTNSYLTSQHETYVESILIALSNPSFAAKARKLHVRDALRSIKKSVSPQTTDDAWEAQIPWFGKTSLVPWRWKQNHLQNDASHILWQPLPEQIMRTTITGIDRASSGTYPIGAVISDNRIYAPLFIAAPPQGYVTFTSLFESLNNASTRLPNGNERALPFAITFMLEGDGLAGNSLKKTLAKVLAFAGSNANIKGAFDGLNYYAASGGVVVGLSISCMTWAENTPFGIDEIQIRRSKLWRTMEAWGGCQVAEKGGDPILGFTSNVHGLSYKHHAPKSVAPLYDALFMMPWCRPASPFSTGTILNRSVDGKLMLQEAFSSDLTTWIKIYVGKPGSGKSVAMNNDIFESCLLPGLKRLPYIFMIDVGISSQGCIDLLKDHLPIDMQHLATYQRLQNDSRYAINPLETAVGRMLPTASETEQMVSFLSTLITPIEAENKAEKGLANFLTMVVQKTFISKKEGEEKAHPNIYERNVNRELDQILDKNNINAERYSYFKLADLCHAKKLYRARDLCHRLAMPTIGDMVPIVANDSEIISTYSNSNTTMGGTFIQLLIRGVQEAITMYPIFASTTTFDIDTARIVSLDLQDVVGKNPKQSSLFFQIARIFAKKKIAFSKEDIPLFPEKYREYYTRLVEDISEDKKILAMDELHHAKRDEVLFREILRDCREARKWNMALQYASQDLEDFGQITRIATMFVIADRGTPDSIKYMEDAISLRPEEREALTQNVQLSPSGLTYFSKITGKMSSYVSLMTLTIGPQKLWALNTDPDDRLLRNAMYEAVGSRPVALKLLAKSYPYGAKKAIAIRREAMRTQSALVNQEEDESIAKIMAKEIIDNFQRLEDYQIA